MSSRRVLLPVFLAILWLIGDLTPAARAQAPDDDKVSRLLMGLSPVPLRHGSEVSATTFTADGKTIVTVSNEAGKVFHWDAATGKLLRTWGPQDGRFRTSAISAGGQVLAVTTHGDGVMVWDGGKGKVVHTLKDASGPTVAISADGKSVVTGLQDGSLGVWDAGTGKLRGKLPNSRWSEGLPVSFSPDGKQIAASRPDTTIGIWDAASGKETASLPAGTADIKMVAFAPGNDVLASVTGNGVVKIWSVSARRERRDWQLAPGHQLTCGFFTPDGRSLVTGGADGAVRILEMASGKERHCVPAMDDGVAAAALAPDGRSVVLGSGRGTALVHQIGGTSATDGQVVRAALPKDIATAWEDLASADPAKGFRAVEMLTGNPDGLAHLQKQLRPVKSVEGDRVSRLIKEMEDPKFSVRQRAMKELEQLYEAAEAGLEAVLRDSPSLETEKRVQMLLKRMRTQGAPPERLRTLRALETLEKIGTPAARTIIEALAGGAAEDTLTVDARATLARMKKPANEKK